MSLMRTAEGSGLVPNRESTCRERQARHGLRCVAQLLQADARQRGWKRGDNKQQSAQHREDPEPG